MATSSADVRPRRRWWRTVAILAALAALAIWTVGIEPRWVAQRKIEVAMPGWEAPPLRVAVASDWHLDHRAAWRVMTPERARAIVRDINAAAPDVVLLPGDFITQPRTVGKGGGLGPDEIAAIVGQLRAPLGVWAVLGNHDNWHGSRAVADALRRRGVQVLENEARQIGPGLWLAGVGDHSTHASRPDQALALVPEGAQLLVMMHDPASLFDMPRRNALMVAGHTHGGQVRLPGLGALVVPGAAPREWSYGWIEHKGNRAWVTSGLGVSILPVRLLSRPEWVLFTIGPAQG